MKIRMIRNIDTDYVLSRMRDVGITPKEMCMRLGKGDSYMGSIKRNGISEKGLKILAMWLDVEEDEPSLYVGGVPITDDTMERDTTITNWSVRDSNELHKMRSDMAKMRADMERTMGDVKELRRMMGRIARELGTEEVHDLMPRTCHEGAGSSC